VVVVVVERTGDTLLEATVRPFLAVEEGSTATKVAVTPTTTRTRRVRVNRCRRERPEPRRRPFAWSISLFSGTQAGLGKPFTDYVGRSWRAFEREREGSTDILPVLSQTPESRVPSILDVIVDPTSHDDVGRVGG
jgi:hypothetical protein